MLGAGTRHIDPQVAGQHDRGVELLVRVGTAAERLCELLGEGDAVPLDGQVDVEAGLTEQQVANGAADQVHTVEAGRSLLDGAPERLQAGPLQQLGQVLAGNGSLVDSILPKRRQEVASGDDAEHLLDGGRCVAGRFHHRQPPGGGRAQRPLHLGHRGVG